MAIYGYHTGHTYEFLRHWICTQYVSIIYCICFDYCMLTARSLLECISRGSWFTNWMSNILTKFDLDSLNVSEEEWILVRAFVQISLSLFIAYFSSMLSGICDILLKLGGCQGWALTSTPLPLRSGIQIELRKYLTRSICNSYSLASPEECKLMRFEIGKQTGNTFDNVYLLSCHKYHYKL